MSSSPKNILFVDDEPKVLEGLENLMYPFMDQWSFAFAANGDEALERLSSEDFDVIVTDMQMPGMNGATLLRHTKERFPNVVRIVLSGHSELQSALEAMPIAHQFLSKPCSADRLISVLTRACALQTLIHDDFLRGLVGTVGELPSRPKIYSELTRLLLDDRTSLLSIAKLIEQDIAISAKILQVVNTAFFSRGGYQVHSVQQAVPRLGAKFVRDLVLMAEVFEGLSSSELDNFSIEELHQHSFLTGSIAKQLVHDPNQANEAFLAGSLHDVGKLIMANTLPDVFRQSLRRSAQTGTALFRVEYELLAVSHAEIGAYLLGLWGLPYSVMEATANHHTPSRVPTEVFDLVGAVHVANCFAHEILDGVDAEATLDREYLEKVGQQNELAAWRSLALQIAETSS